MKRNETKQNERKKGRKGEREKARKREKEKERERKREEEKERKRERKKEKGNKKDSGGLHQSNLADGSLSAEHMYAREAEMEAGRVLLLPSLGCDLDCTYHGYGYGCNCGCVVCVWW